LYQNWEAQSLETMVEASGAAVKTVGVVLFRSLERGRLLEPHLVTCHRYPKQTLQLAKGRTCPISKVNGAYPEKRFGLCVVCGLEITWKGKV